MTVSPAILELLIIASTLFVAIAPVVLIMLWFKDKNGGDLW